MSTQADTQFTTAEDIAEISEKVETAIANWQQVLRTYRSQNTASTVETLQQHINAALLTLSTEYKAFQKDMDDPSKFSPYLVEGMTKLDAKLDSFGQVGNAANWAAAAATMAFAPPAAWVVAEPLLSLRERTGAKHDKLTSYVAAIGEKVKAQKTNCYSGTIGVKPPPEPPEKSAPGEERLPDLWEPENTCDVFDEMEADLKFADDLLGICGKEDVDYKTPSYEAFCKTRDTTLTLPHHALSALGKKAHHVSPPAPALQDWSSKRERVIATASS